MFQAKFKFQFLTARDPSIIQNERSVHEINPKKDRSKANADDFKTNNQMLTSKFKHG